MNKFAFIFMPELISGRIFSFEAMHPVNESAFVKEGSSSVSIEMLAPGEIYSTSPAPVRIERIFVFIVL